MIDWPAVTYEALQEPASLARVLAAMGFAAHLGTVPRGDVRFWQPDYARGPGARRHGFGAMNRSMRDALVHILHDPAAGLFFVCSYRGEWRGSDGSQRGDDLPSLGALRWRLTPGQAAGRIARIIGLNRIPEAARA
jgi:hypothetical protein